MDPLSRGIQSTGRGSKGRVEMKQSESLTQHLNQLAIISLAIMGGVVLFSAVVGYLLGEGTLPQGDADFPPWMSPLFNGVSLVVLVKALFLPRLFAPPTAGAPEEEWLAWHKKSTIVGYALMEGAALIALVGVILTGRSLGAIFMVGLALLAMVFAWPRADQLEG